MPDDPSKPVPLEAVEAAAKAMWKPMWNEPPLYPDDEARTHEKAQAAIHAFLDAMGVTVEESEIGEQSGAILKEYRLSPSRWFPIKGPVDE